MSFQEKKDLQGQRTDVVPRLLIVEARYYAHINDILLGGACETLKAEGVGYDVVTVPGVLEIPIAAAILVEGARHPSRYSGVVALGCVIRGETYHFEIVANNGNGALTSWATTSRTPLGNAVLTVENEAQAIERAYKKGSEAVRAALTLFHLKKAHNPCL